MSMDTSPLYAPPEALDKDGGMLCEKKSTDRESSRTVVLVLSVVPVV